MLGPRKTITWTVAILVGIAQVVAGIFPGTSRSGATIFVALLAGTTDRGSATEFAFHHSSSSLRVRREAIDRGSASVQA